MTTPEVAGLILALAALITSLAQLAVALNTHGVVSTQVHQTNGLTENVAQLNRSLGRAEGVASVASTATLPLVPPGPVG